MGREGVRAVEMGLVTIFGTCSLLQVPKFNLMNVEAPLASREDLLPLFYMVHDVLAMWRRGPSPRTTSLGPVLLYPCPSACCLA